MYWTKTKLTYYTIYYHFPGNSSGLDKYLSVAQLFPFLLFGRRLWARWIIYVSPFSDSPVLHVTIQAHLWPRPKTLFVARVDGVSPLLCVSFPFLGPLPHFLPFHRARNGIRVFRPCFELPFFFDEFEVRRLLPRPRLSPELCAWLFYRPFCPLSE